MPPRVTVIDEGGQIVVVTRYWSDVARTTPVDPTVVLFRVQGPEMEGDDADYVYGSDDEVTRRAEGIYEFRYNPESPGAWFVRDETSDPQHSHEHRFQVRKSRFDDTPGGGS